MVVGNGQQLAFPIDDPSFTVGRLAFGAMSVTAGIVAYRLYATRLTNSDMTSQSLSPTQRQGPEGFPDLCYGVKLLFKCRAMKMDNIAKLMLRSQCT